MVLRDDPAETPGQTNVTSIESNRRKTTPGISKGSIEYEIGPELGSDGKPTTAGWRWIGRQLRAELPTRDFTGRGGKKFNFITARQVFDLLDKVVNPGNWSSDIKIVRSEHPVCVSAGIAIFGVWKWDVGYSNNPESVDELVPVTRRVRDPAKPKDPNAWVNETVFEEDGATPKLRRSEEEPLKAATSDALKRAAVQHGIGRFLYPEMAGH